MFSPLQCPPRRIAKPIFSLLVVRAGGAEIRRSYPSLGVGHNAKTWRNFNPGLRGNINRVYEDLRHKGIQQSTNLADVIIVRAADGLQAKKRKEKKAKKEY